MGFLGSYVHQVDAKGRVAVPAAHRKGLPPGSVVAKGPEGRLVIRPAAEWDAFVEAHRLTASTPAEERAYLRTIYASAREVELDAQGRLLLEAEHRRWAGIDQRAVFVGLGSAVEVVGEETWDGEQAGMDQAAFTALNDRVTARATAAPATTAPPA